MFRCADCEALNLVNSCSSLVALRCGRCSRTLDLSSAPQPIRPHQLEQVVSAATVPVLVDVWAPWCSACSIWEPILIAAARARAGSLLMLRLNAQEFPEEATERGVRVIPTLLLYNRGVEVARHSGVLPAPLLDLWIDRHRPSERRPILLHQPAA